MDTEYKGIVFRNFLIFGMCRILRVLNRMGQFRKVVFNFLNGFLSDMALYNKFGLSLLKEDYSDFLGITFSLNPRKSE